MQVVLAMFRSDGDRRSFSLHKDMTIVGRRTGASGSPGP